MSIKKSILRGLAIGVLAFPLAAVADLGVTMGIAAVPQEYDLHLNTKDYSMKTFKSGTIKVTVRAYENRVYAATPIDKNYETMNIYVPEAYYRGKEVNGYTTKTAPVFLINTIGGYMPGAAGHPGEDLRHGGADAALTALLRGYVVAEPGARGRTLQNVRGQYTGKAPACIVDLKAAVRYLRYNKNLLPGNTERIISDGTSAGGAMSALLGASGNSVDYEPYLKEIGAANERDDIFAVMAYCPIANLENADMAYEWVFNGVNDYHQHKMPAGLGMNGKAKPLGNAPTLMRPVNAPEESAATAWMKPVQIKASAELKDMFPAYVNSLGLKDSQGNVLTLDAKGNGTFKDYIQSVYMASAQSAINNGKDLSGLNWLTIKDGKVIGMDMAKYAVYATRMKATPAFDAFDLSSGENDEFGTKLTAAKHFTTYSKTNSSVASTMADPFVIKMMNPMAYIGEPGAVSAKYWRIRHGAIDRDTSLAIPAILALKAQNAGYSVDFASPWGRGHDGDYDLSELFAWADKICK